MLSNFSKEINGHAISIYETYILGYKIFRADGPRGVLLADKAELSPIQISLTDGAPLKSH